MNSWAVRMWLLVAFCLATAYGGWISYRLMQASQPTAIVLPAQVSTSTHRDAPIADFTLKDQTGQAFGTRELRGRVWVASFFFASCPGTCKQLNLALASLNDQVPQDVRLVSVTCDPENDTPEALASYSQTFGADPARWKFLTGDMADLQRVGQDIFQVVLAQGTHSERAFVVDRAGRVRGRFSVLDPVEVKKLARLVNELDQQPAPTGASDPAAEVTATENSDSAEAGQPAQATKTGTAEFGGADPDAATSGAADSSGPATEPAGAR